MIILAIARLTKARLAGILTHVPDAAAEFTSSAVFPTLQKACAQASFGCDGAELLRLSENAIYELATVPVVVRIARSADRLPRVKRELCVARWLAAAHVSAIRVYEEMDQPMLVDGHPVSFWHTVTGGDPIPTHVDLARLLAAFHAAANCPCELASFDPLKPRRPAWRKPTEFQAATAIPSKGAAPN